MSHHIQLINLAPFQNCAHGAGYGAVNYCENKCVFNQLLIRLWKHQLKLNSMPILFQICPSKSGASSEKVRSLQSHLEHEFSAHPTPWSSKGSVTVYGGGGGGVITIIRKWGTEEHAYPDSTPEEFWIGFFSLQLAPSQCSSLTEKQRHMIIFFPSQHDLLWPVLHPL